MRDLAHRLGAFFVKPKIAFGGATAIALIAILFAWYTSAVAPAGQYTRAVMAPITAVGGANSDLSFQIPGQVIKVPVVIGQTVAAGDSLVTLDQAALLASRAGAAANVEAAEARLATLLSGTRPEQLAINKTTFTQAQISLRDTIRTAYLTADNAVHTTADQLFTNPRTSSPALIFTPTDQSLQNSVIDERKALEGVLASWSAEVNGAGFDTSDPLASAATAKANLAQVMTFLNDTATLLTESAGSSGLSPATLAGYQAGMNAARSAVSGSLSSLTGGVTAVESAQGVLTLAQAGATANDIAAARATADAASAVLRGIDVTLRESTLTAPFAGTVTALNAHIGQTVAPGQIIVSVESSGGSKASALVVPTSSVITDGGQSFVYLKTKGSPVKTLVTTGLVSTDGMTEILSGLSVGDEVLTFGVMHYYD